MRLSPPDVEATLVEALSRAARCRSSRYHGSAPTFALDLASWSQRRLDDVRLGHLSLDGRHFDYFANSTTKTVNRRTRSSFCVVNFVTLTENCVTQRSRFASHLFTQVSPTGAADSLR